MFPYILPGWAVAEHPAMAESEEAIAAAVALRERLRRMDDKVLSSKWNGPFFKWQQLTGSPIAEVDYYVPRRPNLLREWGLTSDDFSDAFIPNDILVRTFFPRNLLEQANTTEESDNEVSVYGTRRIQLEDLSGAPEDVQILVHFHGGGLSIGQAYDSVLKYVVEILQLQTVKSDAVPPLIIASVEYSLVPEHPFPGSCLEALTVVSHFADQYPDRSIHLSGASAGGYLSIVAAMEGFRRYPGRIQSVLSGCPMLSPACDTLSCYLNSKCAYSTLAFVRWSWRAFLELPETKDTKPSEGEATLEETLAIGSNRTTWRESKWHGSSLQRLLTPIVDLPPGLDTDAAPRIVLTTNKGDPLYSEGSELAKKLEELGAHVLYLDHGGSHWAGTALHEETTTEFLCAWRDIMFPS